MSELINNRQKQQEVLKEIILELHAGKDVKEVKDKFKRLIKAVGPGEIAQLEDELIKQGIKEEEIQKLCDVHLSIFEDALILPEEEPKDAHHPLEIFRGKNNATLTLVNSIKSLLAEENLTEETLAKWQDLHKELLSIDTYYQMKEHLLFPYLEKKGFYGPPAVMWSTHDEIRDKLKSIMQNLEVASVEDLNKTVREQTFEVLQQIDDMVNKEEKILFPLCLEHLSETDWQAIQSSMPEFGYTVIEPIKKQPQKIKNNISAEGRIDLGSGSMNVQELTAFLNSLPIDITFVDANREVRYFNESKERIFARPRTVIGRKVEKCHPPESVHIVDRIIEELKSGKRESADFWVNLNNRLVYIRYFPVRSSEGEFLGVLEVTQDITSIQKLSGEKRLLDDK